MVNPKNRIQHDSGNFSTNDGDGVTSNTWGRAKYVSALRVLLADIPELNTIHGVEEQSDDKLGLIMDLILSDFNHEPPATRFSFENFPNPNCLLRGAIAMALDSASIMHARNAMSYSDNGLAIEDFGKDVRYAPILARAAQDYLRLTDTLKRTWNASNCFGGVSSEYRFINGRRR